MPQDGYTSAPPSQASAPPLLASAASWLAGNPGRPTTVAGSDHRRWRVAGFQQTFTVQHSDGTTTTLTGTIVVGIDASEAYTTIRQLIGVDVIVSMAILLVVGIAGFGLVRSNLRPLVDIEETAGEIAEGHLNRRVPERDPRTEVGSLGRSLNTMLSQIETAFHAREESEAAAHQSEERMRRFIADASHELRTPLTTIRGFAEYYRQRGGLLDESSSGLSPEDLNRIMNRVEAEAARMGVLVEDLLLLARMDQQRPLARNPVDMLTLAADAMHDTRVLAPNRDISLSVQPGAAFLVNGDEPRLRQVIGNLLSNALTHTPDGTPIEMTIGMGTLRDESGPQAVVLTITDHGPGMTREQADRVFERFYRADPARTRAKGGSGLGLAIVAALVDAHDGAVSVRTAPGEGATFQVALPLSPEAQGPQDEPE
jgi:two-component system OmpR family sensor kinase